jgi:hypothetical protein
MKEKEKRLVPTYNIKTLALTSPHQRPIPLPVPKTDFRRRPSTRRTYAHPSARHHSLDTADFGDMALTLCTICTAVAHGRPVHGFFRVGRVAAVVVVACARGVGPCTLRQAFVDVARVEGAGEGALCAGGSLHGWETLGSESGDTIALGGGVRVGRHGGGRHSSRRHGARR